MSAQKLNKTNGYTKTNYKIKMVGYLRNSYRRVWEKDERLFTSFAGTLHDVTDDKSKFIYFPQ